MEKLNNTKLLISARFGLYSNTSWLNFEKNTTIANGKFKV
jgi:hypothetical protein